MSQTERIPLEPGTELRLNLLESSGRSDWIIVSVIGYGGSCIVYRATQKSELFSGRKGVIKEFYPQGFPSVTRVNGELEIPEEEKDRFSKKKDRFFDGFSHREMHSTLDSDHAMTLPRVFGEANNTWYAVSDENTGSTLLELDRRDLNLNRIAQIMDSLCSAISVLHENGYLYLDCKPDNVNAYCLDRRDHIRLFDFDTVQAKKTLRKSEYSTYSDGWAPPEQKNWRIENISERTDIYSLGAVFFWLLTGRKPVGDTYMDDDADNDLNQIKLREFDWRELPICANASDSTTSLIQRICEKTLTVPSLRYDSVSKMQIDLRELLDKTGSNPTVENLVTQAKRDLSNVISEGISIISKQISNLQNTSSSESTEHKKQRILPSKVNRFLYNSETIPYTGRESELNYLLKMCESDELPFCWLGIYGNGGSGKTRLAFEVCKVMSAKGWRTTWPSHVKSNIDQVKHSLCTNSEEALICFDDIVEDIDIVTDFIFWCGESQEIAAKKIRLLLLDRVFDDLLQECYNYFLYHDYEQINSTFLDTDGLLKICPCGPETLSSIISNYSKNVYNRDTERETLDYLSKKTIEIDENKRPLFALFVADAWCNNTDIANWNRTDALEAVIKRETEKAINYIKLEYEKKSEQSMILNAYKIAVLCASFLPENSSLSYVCSLVETIFHSKINSNNIEWIFRQLGLVGDDGLSLASSFPDLVCEYFSIRYINNLNKNQVIVLAMELIKRDYYSVIGFIRGICDDYNDLLIAPSNMSAFQFILEETEVRIGERISEGICDDRLDQFDVITTDDAAMEWLTDNKPNYREIICQVVSELSTFFMDNLNHAFTKKKVAQPEYTYNGDYLFTWRCGKGTIEYSDHTVYEGEWNKDEINGYGTMKWADGTYYSGDWLSGRRSGHGKMVFSDNATYEGHWLDNYRDGRGIMSFNNGAVFDGEWQHGQMICGKMTYPNSMYYEGEFSEGRPNGKGSMTYTDGSVYNGMWKMGKRYGPGRMSFSDGRICDGEWVSDTFIGSGE